MAPSSPESANNWWFGLDWFQWNSVDKATEEQQEPQQPNNNPTTFVNHSQQHSFELKSQNSLLVEAVGPKQRSKRNYYPKRRESLEELAQRFVSTQQLLFDTKSNKQRERIVQNVRRQSILRQRREQEHANRLRNAMILTMLSSGDAAAQQSAMDAVRNNSPMIVNPYQILQVRRDATPSEIRQAYRRLALWHHPGRCAGVGPEERHRRLQVFEIVAASYETLLDRESRTRCDLLLRESYAEHARSKDIPAGQVCVGGKPLEQKERNRNNTSESGDPETFMARVIGRLAVRTVADETDDDMSGCKIPPNMEPVSSDSSLEPPDGARDDLTDCSSDFSGGQHRRPRAISIPTTAAPPKSLPSPRIHMPLGTPLGTPRAASPEESSLTNGSPQHGTDEPDEGFLAIGACGMNTLTSFDSQVALPALVNSSSSGEPQRAGEIHYTEGETNRLFGGPLQLLYRARRWRPFKDPFEVFCEVFGSRVPLGGKPNLDKLDTTQAPPSMDNNPNSLLLPPSLNSSSGWTGTSETLADGTVLFRTSRILQNRKMTRTEAVRIDPETGLRHSHVTVTSEYLDKENQNDEAASKKDAKEAFSFWSYFTCEPVWTSCEGIGCTMASSSHPEGVEPKDATMDKDEFAEDNSMFCGSGLSWC